MVPPMDGRPVDAGAFALPAQFENWFASRGWQPRAHQLELARLGLAGKSALLIAPTGGGKTLAGFLPSLIDLSSRGGLPLGRARSLHTIYISPLKALAVDIARNLEFPVREMELPITIETRTGDTPTHKRTRQRTAPPDILLTTPEQLALLLASSEGARFFRGLKFVIIDELHAMSGNKRGHLLGLGLARLRALAPGMTAIGLSATVKYPDELRKFLVAQLPSELSSPVYGGGVTEGDGGGGDNATPLVRGVHPPAALRANRGAAAPPVNGGRREARKRAPLNLADLVEGARGAVPEIGVHASQAHIPWSGHSGRHAIAEVYERIKTAHTALIFVNTRSQAELAFQELWRINDDNLPIALHHGSLAVEQRRKVETAMTRGGLRAVVCTSTLDLGIDWGDVDLVIQMGAPKGASRLLQRIGRSNHRLDEPSQALLVPSNRFEVLECTAAREAVIAHVLDGDPPRMGALDVLAQHIFGSACGGPFHPDLLYSEVTSAAPYSNLSRETFDRVVDFVATGGYALRSYDRFRRLVPMADGRLRLAHPQIAQRYRLNVGTIIEAPMVKVRLVRGSKPGQSAFRGGRVLGEMEEYFIEQLTPGDTFLFAGRILRFEGLHETEAWASPSNATEAAIPSYDGGKFPLSTYLAERVRHIIATPAEWQKLPDSVREWLEIQRLRSVLPKQNEMLVETFPHGARYYLTAYPFEGRLAHQTLGMLLTRRLERLHMRPMGFVANEYALQIWALRDMSGLNMAKLFDEDMLGDDLEAWLAESALLKRSFRQCAVIGGLIERKFPGQEKTGRQVTFSADLIYNVLRSHEPDHILLQATREDATAGLLDIRRLGALLKRSKGRIVLKSLTRVSPLAVPVMLEIDRVPVAGEANEAILDLVAEELIEEAMRLDG